jgi:two-component system cell cycle response regulator
MRILVAEAGAELAASIYRPLAHAGHDVRHVADGNAAWAALQDEDAFEVAIIGLRLPGMGGLDLARHIRQRPRVKPLHVILAGEWGAEEEFSAAVRAGADDALWSRPVDVRELHGRIYIAHRRLKLQATLDSVHEALKAQAMNDPLTGLWNRGAIVEMLVRELARAQREATPTSVVIGDIDRFKSVNETHGLETADVVLREAARRMRASVRTYDGVGRYGGDEVMLVLPRCDTQDALNLAERIRVSVGETPVNTGLAKVSATVSLGVATCAAGGALDAAELIRRAEGALAKAKERHDATEYAR